ncbi:MAG: VWA domain-containing protein [Clostridiaceae bacterium]
MKQIGKALSAAILCTAILASMTACSSSSKKTEDSNMLYSRVTSGSMNKQIYGVAPMQNAAEQNDYSIQAEQENSAGFNTEEYKSIEENRMMKVGMSPLSTFSIDVDTASYSNVRRYLEDRQLPPADAVRIEELVNYFSYDLPEPTGEAPFSVSTEISLCPWNPENYLAMIALQGKNVRQADLPLSNLVFLLDVSGSMDDPMKLPLLKSSFQLLIEQLDENDKVSIVVYAGSSGMILEGARGDEKERIMAALDELQAGGSTAGGEGIALAYKIANKNYISGGNNRVILATDGDFNVGVSSEGELTKLIEERRKGGICLSVLGFGTGNIKDNKMETLADKGNGNYAYIDSLAEARKVLVNEMGGTLLTIAKDVKIQVEFNPMKVKEYRLVGYDNRILKNEDFDDDTKDAGEIGAGHNVIAFYEIIPYKDGETIEKTQLKYQSSEVRQEWENEWMEIRLRYKEPDKETSQKIVRTVTQNDITNNPSGNYVFASAVAEYGLLLRNSRYKGQASWDSVRDRASNAIGDDTEEYRSNFLRLVKSAESLSR